ncbi:ABC transporter permease [Rhizobium chutanense]|uniref:ABC transporter permease n=1 Tax=Rhizobium chutanense TaxID=2035448 RepID=A0A2A6J679_9HYPH|nr:sugar ABC transporter permease [Rhizobium chutanense]PDT01656.1 sugar ABC transporter permease [Rhizobium chutanense]RUM01154.1 ABC transporter permease [Rhizobium chutanense]
MVTTVMNSEISEIGRSNALRTHKSIWIGFALLACLLALGALLVPGFVSSQNARSILLLAAFLGLASVGQTLCALVGALDLSIPYIIGGANILLPSLMVAGLPAPVAMAVVLVLGALVGAANGALSFKLQGQALIMSLGVGFAAVGAVQIYTSLGSQFGGTVFAPVPVWLRNLSAFNGKFFGLPFPPVIVIWAVVAVMLGWLMYNTWFGRSIYAIGGSRTAAARLGISEFKVWTVIHSASGAMSAITGMLLLGFSGGGFVGVGDPYLFTTVAAVVIGGTSLLGGAGGYGATVLGVLVLTVLTSLLVGLGLGFPAQQAVVGLLIVPMVAIYARTPHIRNQI